MNVWAVVQNAMRCNDARGTRERAGGPKRTVPERRVSLVLPMQEWFECDRPVSVQDHLQPHGLYCNLATPGMKLDRWPNRSGS